MSGGVDSSVAAALLKERGTDVVGVTMYLHEEEREPKGGRGCCGSRAIRDAARVASTLGIPHYAWDFRKEFEAAVVEDFCAEYARGRTPNPCIRCNERVKFTALLGRAAELGAGMIATGHHARIVRDDNGAWRLCKGADARKDQSYFLYSMTQEQMARVLMPVGEYTKDQVRGIARRLGLPVAEKPESQEICFVPDDDYAGFLRRRRPELLRAGSVLDTGGNVVGGHEGIAGFTVGQRKGLGLAFGERRYVVRIDASTNSVVLGEKNEARGRVIEAGDVNWISGRPPELPVRTWAKVRYQSRGGAAAVEPFGGDRARVVFDEPQWAPTPGQAVVFWQDDAVLGGGTIEQSRPE
jgi:tRNA-specific 2-thiouridylase